MHQEAKCEHARKYVQEVVQDGFSFQTNETLLR